MPIFSLNKIKKLKERLYKKKVSGLLIQGTKGLSPLEKYKTDEKGRPLVHVQKIIEFFLDEINAAGDFLSDDYCDALYTLLQEFGREAEAVSFTCGVSVSLEQIAAADNKTTIDLLATNIIITYFNSLKDHKGRVDTSLLSKDLSKLITKSNAGRDYKKLVNSTLDGLIKRLNQDKPWRHYLDEINNADLICRLTGYRLPPMPKDVIARTLKKCHGEIAACNDLFTKVMASRGNLIAHEENKKKYLKLMERLDSAIFNILERTDKYLAAAHRLMALLNLSYSVVIGEAHDSLRKNLVRLFLNTKPGKDDRRDMLKNLGVAQLRYRLNTLFNYPQITLYACAFKNTRIYSSFYFDIFRLLFKTAAEQLMREDTDVESIERTLNDLIRAVENLNFSGEQLNDEKQVLQSAYISLILKIDVERLDHLMGCCDPICRATRDQARAIMADVRPALVTACFAALCRGAAEDQSAQKTVTFIKKYLNAYAFHYKPQRDFYRFFFDTCVCSGSRPAAPMAQLIGRKKAVAAAVLMVFADETSMKELISQDRILSAATMLKQMVQKS